MWEMMLHNVNNNQVYRLNFGSSHQAPLTSDLCSKPRRKFVQTSYAMKSQFIGLILSLTVKAMFFQSRSSESHNIRTSSVPSVKRILYVESAIQCHPYWCRQESRTVCPRNMQLMPRLFLKLTKIWQQQNGKFVDFNDHTPVWRRPMQY